MKKILMNTIAALLLTTGTAKAQDFFNGMPGPRGVQLDSYVNVSERKISGMMIPKIFFENLSETYPGMLTAFPIAVSNKGEVDLKGVNVGLHKAVYSNKNLSLNTIVAVGMFKGNNNTLDNLSTQMYLTGVMKNLSLDLEANVNLNLKKGTKTKTGALTLGYGNDMVRAGGSVKFQDGKEPQYQGILRVDLTKDHQYWLEGYISKQRAGIRFAANF